MEGGRGGEGDLLATTAAHNKSITKLQGLVWSRVSLVDTITGVYRVQHSQQAH